MWLWAVTKLRGGCPRTPDSEMVKSVSRQLFSNSKYVEYRWSFICHITPSRYTTPRDREGGIRAFGACIARLDVEMVISAGCFSLCYAVERCLTYDRPLRPASCDAVCCLFSVCCNRLTHVNDVYAHYCARALGIRGVGLVFPSIFASLVLNACVQTSLTIASQMGTGLGTSQRRAVRPRRSHRSV